MAQWYAVYTRPCWEKKVAESFQKRRLPCFLPQNKVLVATNYTEKRKPVFQPLFESCVFVKTTEDKLGTIKAIDGVLSFYFWQNKPATIRDIEIEMIRRFLAEHQSVSLYKSAVNLGEIVKIAECESDENTSTLVVQKVQLSLPSLGFVLEAEIMEPISLKTRTAEIQLRPTLA